jgi:hypothetical protein
MFNDERNLGFNFDQVLITDVIISSVVSSIKPPVREMKRIVMADPKALSPCDPKSWS